MSLRTSWSCSGEGLKGMVREGEANEDSTRRAAEDAEGDGEEAGSPQRATEGHGGDESGEEGEGASSRKRASCAARRSRGSAHSASSRVWRGGEQLGAEGALARGGSVAVESGVVAVWATMSTDNVRHGPWSVNGFCLVCGRLLEVVGGNGDRGRGRGGEGNGEWARGNVEEGGVPLARGAYGALAAPYAAAIGMAGVVFGGCLLTDADCFMVSTPCLSVLPRRLIQDPL